MSLRQPFLLLLFIRLRGIPPCTKITTRFIFLDHIIQLYEGKRTTEKRYLVSTASLYPVQLHYPHPLLLSAPVTYEIFLSYKTTVLHETNRKFYFSFEEGNFKETKENVGNF